MSPTSLKIDVEQFTARLVTLDDHSREVTFFVHSGGSSARRPESIGDRLNDPETLFLPCRVDGAERLIRVEWIACVEFPELPPEIRELAEVGARSSGVTFHLVTGSSLRGDLVYEGGSLYGRVSDYLNRLSRRFVLLRTPESAFYINREAIALVDV